MKKVARARLRSSIRTKAGVSLAGPSSKPIATSRRGGPLRYATVPRLRQPTRRKSAFGCGGGAADAVVVGAGGPPGAVLDGELVAPRPLPGSETPSATSSVGASAASSVKARVAGLERKRSRERTARHVTAAGRGPRMFAQARGGGSA